METIVDSLFEEHKNLINRTIRKNRPLLSALRLEDEDVAQELSVTLFLAIGRFDPGRSESLAAYIWYSLQYEILNIKRRHKPHGITGLPRGYRQEFLYLDRVLPDGGAYELPACDDTSGFEMSELFNSFTGTESETVSLKLRGFPAKRKVHVTALESAGQRYAGLYAGSV